MALVSPRTSPPRRARFPVSLAVIAVAMVGGAVFTVADRLGSGGSSLGDGDRTTTTSPPGPLARARSERVRPPAAALAIGAGPSAYTVTYEINAPGAPRREEVISVERPYASRRTTETDVTTTGFARLQVEPRSGARTIASPPPAAVDPRPSVVVGRAVAEGFIAAREHRRIAGTTCRVHRTRSPVSSSTISAPLPRNYTDICISDRGLVLEEWEVDDGRAVRQRVAVRVTSGADVADVTDPPTLTAAQGGGSVLAVDPQSRPEGRFYEADPPVGFSRRGRYSVVPPQAGLTDEQARRRAIASTADVFERDDDVIVVDRGSTLNLDRAFEPRPEGRPVPDLGPAFAEAGELLLGWTGPEVRWADDDGRFVRVYGTVDVDVLLQVMRSLRVTEGGTGLVFTGAPL